MGSAGEDCRKVTHREREREGGEKGGEREREMEIRRDR